MTWVVVALVVGVLASVCWLAFGAHTDKAEMELRRRRTAEQRLADQETRNVRRLEKKEEKQ